MLLSSLWKHCNPFDSLCSKHFDWFSSSSTPVGSHCSYCSTKLAQLSPTSHLEIRFEFPFFFYPLYSALPASARRASSLNLLQISSYYLTRWLSNLPGVHHQRAKIPIKSGSFPPVCTSHIEMIQFRFQCGAAKRAWKTRRLAVFQANSLFPT